MGILMTIDSRVLDTDVEAGIVTMFHYDDADDSMTIEEIQDVEPLAELNKARLNASERGWKGDLHMVASIGIIEYQKLLTSGCTKSQRCMKRWLNDRDNRVFRTKEGRV